MVSLGKRIQIEEESDSESLDFENDFGFESKKVENWFNKQRVLICASRRIRSRERHLMADFLNLLPHAKKENKLEKDQIAEQLKDIVKMNSCNNLLFFDQKRTNIFLWMGKSPKGPSANFKIEDITTTKELKMTGNCLKFSRAILSFDKSFDESPQMKIYKELLVDAFGTPNNHPKSKPFVDHSYHFSWADNRIWFRHYQIYRDEKLEKNISNAELVEIGPRFSLNPIKIFDEFMGGKVIFENPFYIPPAKRRKRMLKQKAKEFLDKLARKKRKKDLIETVMETDGLNEIFGDQDAVSLEQLQKMQQEKEGPEETPVETKKAVKKGKKKLKLK